MKKSRGKIVTWRDKDNNKHVGIAYDNEQAAEFKQVKKAFVRHIDGDTYQPIKEMMSGKNIVGLYDAEKLTIIGFVD